MRESLLTGEERSILEALQSNQIKLAMARRILALLAYDDGLPTRQVAQIAGRSPSRVRTYRREFLRDGMANFDKERQTVVKPAGGDSAPGKMIRVDEASTKLHHPTHTIPGKGVLLPTTSTQQTPESPLEVFAASAAAYKSPGIAPEDSLAEAGRKVLRYQFGQMLLHENGTHKGDDIEELHDMRVATRRMRAAVEVFGDAFQAKALKSSMKGLRATGKALGRVRDLDVILQKAEHYLETQPAEARSSLMPLLKHWQDKRQAARKKMLAYLDSSQYQVFKTQFLTFVTTPGMGSFPPGPGKPSSVRDVAPVLIYRRLAAVRAYEAILENATLEQFHALRIEFKKLRYTVEFFREVLGPEAKVVIRDIKQMQDHLGDLNDAQVATEILRDFLAQWDAEQADLPVNQRHSPDGIMAYLSARYTERYQLMTTFHQAWEHFARQEFRKNLAAAIAAL